MGLRKVISEKYRAPTAIVDADAEVPVWEVEDESISVRLEERLLPYFASDIRTMPSIPGAEVVVDEQYRQGVRGDLTSFEVDFFYLEGTSESDLSGVRRVLISTGLVKCVNAY